MKKKMITALLASAMVLSLVACGGGGTANDEPRPYRFVIFLRGCSSKLSLSFPSIIIVNDLPSHRRAT